MRRRGVGFEFSWLFWFFLSMFVLGENDMYAI